MSRETIKVYGEHGRSARVFLERGGRLVRVQWRRGGQLQTKSFQNTPAGKREAREFAQGVVEMMDGKAPAEAMTLRSLWLRYVEAEFGNLRQRTQVLNRDAWQKWELFNGRETLAADCGPDTMARFRGSLEREGYATSTIARTIRGVRVVYNWGESHELLVSRLHRYRFKVAKNKRTAPVAEFRNEEYQALIAQLPLTSSRTWRAGAVLRICGSQGSRQNSVRHLQPEDIDLESGRIRWRPEWDKLGRDETQPLRRDAREAVVAALQWREKSGYTGPWLIPAPRADGPYSAQALWWALTEAEKRAGIPHERMRGAHGLRRMLAGDVLAKTGNLQLAMRAIRDQDIKQMRRYLIDRTDQMDEVFAAMDGPESVTQTATESEASE
jgi:integrase